MARVKYTAEQIKSMLKETKEMSAKDAAAHLKVSLATLHRWRGEKKAVKAVKKDGIKVSKKVEALFKAMDKTLAQLRKAVA